MTKNLTKLPMLPLGRGQQLNPYLDESSLLMLALVCKKFRNAASYIFRRMPVCPPAIGYASSTDNLQKTALQLASRSHSITIAVDKFSDTSVLDALLKQGIQLDIVLGDLMLKKF